MFKLAVGYEERVVAFIDILGFKAHINESENDSKKFSMLKLSLDYLKNQEHIFNPFGVVSQRCVTSFSDSVVVSYPIQNPFMIIEDLLHLQLDLASNGFFIRGAIAKGNLHHDYNTKIVFGSAMNEAYDLEQNISKYPRIMLSKNYYKELRRLNSNVDYIESRIVKDSDDVYFLNFLMPDMVYKDAESKKSCIISILSFIEEVSEKNRDRPDVISKMDWLKNYIENTIEKYKFVFD